MRGVLAACLDDTPSTEAASNQETWNVSTPHSGFTALVGGAPRRPCGMRGEWR